MRPTRAPAAAVFLAAAVSLASAASAQGFGQNQVRIRDFDWKVRSTEHFDIHYYEGSEPLVPFAARVLERQYARLSRALDVEFDKRRPFFLYADVNDMQQSNIVEVGDGTGGVTESFKDRFMVFNDGSLQWLDTVISHELVHVFQFRILVSGWWRSARIVKTVVYPLWMMEGMAESYSTYSDRTAGELILRDAATSGGLIPLWKLEHFSHLKPHQVRLAYESGGAVMDFLDEEFGPDKVEKLIKAWQTSFESSAVLQDLVGLDIFAFDRKWREYLREKFEREVRERGLREPTDYGEALTTGGSSIPEFNTSPAFSPDGRKMAYMTTRFGFPPSVVLQDLDTGKLRKLVSFDTRIETLEMGHFDNKSRVLSFSPDGSRLAFSGTKNHKDALYVYELAPRRLRKVRVPGFMTVSQPSFSPDGRRIVFSGMREAVSDIFLLDIESGDVRRLTDDPNDDQTPVFSPDGKSVVYSSEIETPGDPIPYQRRLYRADLGTGAVERLEDLRGEARDPVFDADGSRLLFCLEGGGEYELYEMDLRTRGIVRLTRSVGAAYTPAYAPDGQIAFAALRDGSINLYKGPRDRFLSEPAGRTPAEGDVSHLVAASSAPPKMGAAEEAASPFSTDLFLPAFFYSSVGGLFWTSYWQGSDLLGNHQAVGLLSYGSGAGFLDYQGAYAYNRFRTKLQAGIQGRVRRDIFDEGSGLTSDESTHAQWIRAAYPLDRYHRIEALAASVSERYDYQDTSRRDKEEARILGGAFVRDTVHGRYLVANAGSRLRTFYTAAPLMLGGNNEYQTVGAEAVGYTPLGTLKTFVVRGVGVRSWGPDTPNFILGGIGRLRGYGRSDVTDVGSRALLGSAELRFPLLGDLDYYMWYIFPDFYFKMAALSLFTDAGFAWDSRDQLTRAGWEDVRLSYGIGLRLHTFILQLFPLVVHFDYARRTTSDGGIFYVYLGPLF